MAKIKLNPVIAHASGALDGVAFHTDRTGLGLTRKPRSQNPRTAEQSKAKNRFATAASAWRGLTESQRIGYDHYADQLPRTSRVGDTEYVSGFELFLILSTQAQSLPAWTVSTTAAQSITAVNLAYQAQAFTVPAPCYLKSFQVATQWVAAQVGTVRAVLINQSTGTLVYQGDPVAPGVAGSQHQFNEDLGPGLELLPGTTYAVGIFASSIAPAPIFVRVNRNTPPGLVTPYATFLEVVRGNTLPLTGSSTVTQGLVTLELNGSPLPDPIGADPMPYWSATAAAVASLSELLVEIEGGAPFATFRANATMPLSPGVTNPPRARFRSLGYWPLEADVHDLSAAYSQSFGSAMANAAGQIILLELTPFTPRRYRGPLQRLILPIFP